MRGLLGYDGALRTIGKPVSVQGTGMGQLLGATIVFDELIQLGCKKLIRVGTCRRSAAAPRRSATRSWR